MVRLLIRKALQKFGYDIVKTNYIHTPGNVDMKELMDEFGWMKSFGFKTIIDIGANEGQFSEKIRILFPDARIYAFEPIPDTFHKLEKNFGGDSRFKAFNVGLADEAGVFDFELNDYTPSSSLLTMSDTHKSSFDFAKNVHTIAVKIETLDNMLQNEQLPLPILVKIDVQGVEDKVIAGGEHTLRLAAGVISEVSFEELYKGQPLFHSIYEKIHQLGFSYHGSLEQLKSPSGAVLQADAFFSK